MDNLKIPTHVGIIMDGNGRWALMHGKKRSEGHLAGSKTIEELALYAFDLGVKVLSIFAFSTDNFKRSNEEIDYLMNLFIKYFKGKLKRIEEKGVKIVFSGRRSPLRDDVLDAMDTMMKRTKDNGNGVLNICLNYGGQEEIIDAAKKLAIDYKEGKVEIDSINKINFATYLYQDLPPLDLLIRTSGELRISNYMLFQMAYAELYFTDTFFPDFKKEELDKAIASYNKRDRRFGKV